MQREDEALRRDIDYGCGSKMLYHIGCVEERNVIFPLIDRLISESDLLFHEGREHGHGMRIPDQRKGMC